MLFGITLNALAESTKHFSPAGLTEFEAKLYKFIQQDQPDIF